MNLDIIVDSEGQDHLVFDSSQLYDDKLMGSKISDFEVLQLLGEGSFGSVLKIRSLKNNKVYALKVMNLREMSPEARRYTTRERDFLKHLSHPNVIKYYKAFQDVKKDQFFMITELMDNGDLGSLVKTHLELKTKIKEEMLWNIFLQSMSGLAYIHSNGIIHRDIKPQNIFMNNKMAVKIGDFGTCCLDQSKRGKMFMKKKNELQLKGTIVGSPLYMAKEMYGETYDNKVDILAMGLTFFELIYLHPYYELKAELNEEGGMKQVKVRIVDENDKNVVYSKELLQILDYMLSEDPKNRKTSKEIYEMIKYLYSQKYKTNSGIETVIRCMYSLPITNDLMKIMRSESKPIFNAYLNCICSLNLKEFYDYIGDFRQLLAAENSNLEGSKEIPPDYLLAFLFDKLHKELNEPKEISEEKEHKILFSKEANKLNEEVMLLNFVKDFAKRYNSLISIYFLGLMQNEVECQKCKLKTYSYTNFCFATLNLEKVIKYLPPNMRNEQIIIEDGLYEQIKEKKKLDLFCPICLDRELHLKTKKYSILPLCLIIHVYRGVKSHLKNQIAFRKKVNLSSLVTNRFSPNLYILVGIITRVELPNGKDHYNCYIRNPNTKLFDIYTGSEIKRGIKSPIIEEEIYMLFYMFQKK